MVTPADAAMELLALEDASEQLQSYVTYTNPAYITSPFSYMVCKELDDFLAAARRGDRPVLVLQAPPQHGKSELASRKLPAFILGRDPNLRVAAVTYSDEMATNIAIDVRRNLFSQEHLRIFEPKSEKNKFALNRMTEFTAPGGRGSYIGIGVGGGLTGRPYDIGIIDDPTKDAVEALSETTKARHWDWFWSVFNNRQSKYSGQIIMATSWAEDDLPGRIIKHYIENHDDSERKRFRHLCFPAINFEGETGYRPDLPWRGALVPELKPLEMLLSMKNGTPEYWWSAMFQQSAKALGGNVFKESGLQYWVPATLPPQFDQTILSIDCAFKDTDGTDFVVIQVWGKLGANCYLLDQHRERMGFTATCAAIVAMWKRYPQTSAVLIEDKANGPAVIDALKAYVPGIIPIEPDGSKLARAHAVTCYWEAKNIWIPHESVYPWLKEFKGELTAFPTAKHDDQVDGLTQALRYLYPANGTLSISKAAVELAKRMGLR